MRTHIRTLAAATALLTAAACAPAPSPPTAWRPAHTPAPPVPAVVLDAPTDPVPVGAQPRLAADPVQIADGLVADELAIRDPTTSEPALVAAARRQQVAYRAIGRHPEWDGIIGPKIPAALAEAYDRNVDARRQLASMAHVRDTLPAWRVVAPVPSDELLGYYHEAEAASGVGWNFLAAINLIETRLGSIVGLSTAGADGPMQFLPSTFAGYGEGGDIRSPHDSIMAAGRYLAANGFTIDADQAIYRYNHAAQYVAAVKDYAAVLAVDPASFGGFYRWDVYCVTVAGDVVLPIGYASDAPIPVGEYLTSHPQ
ncbi:lytic transglycosylase domain-containing protein [Mycolicibacterium aichiense]|uniref:lytic transglycosylase domain-containing protein n=1 Tax=Mycolicibacterium aichiense TaxID=1799 RepID=UPI003D669AA2